METSSQTMVRSTKFDVLLCCSLVNHVRSIRLFVCKAGLSHNQCFNAMLTMTSNGRKIFLNTQRWRWWLLHVGSCDATGSFVQKVKRLAVGLFGLPLKGILWGWKGFWCHNEPPAATGWKDSSKPFPSSIAENKKWQQTFANAFHFLWIQEGTLNINWINFPSRVITKWTGWNSSYWGVILNSSFIIQLNGPIIQSVNI